MILLFSNNFSNAEAAGCHMLIALINAVKEKPSPSKELKGIVQMTRAL